MQAAVQRIVEYVGLFEHAVGRQLGDAESWSDLGLCLGTEATCSHLRVEADEVAGVVDAADDVEDVELGVDADTHAAEVPVVFRTRSGDPGKSVAGAGVSSNQM